MSKAQAAPSGGRNERFKDDGKGEDVRTSNMIAAKAVADAVRTSLGPKGMDKMIKNDKGEVIITNDGATILSQMQVMHPSAKMLVELSKAQDIAAGDGTTSVVVIAGAFLNACLQLLERGIHPMAISEAFQKSVEKAEEILTQMAVPVDLGDRDTLIKAATTCLSSKVVSANSEMLAPLAVDSVLSVIDPAVAKDVDLNDIKIVKQLGGTIDDTVLVDGLVFNRRAARAGTGVTRMENAKVGLIQFCLSAPKTDMENSVVVSDYAAMDRVLREERKYIAKMCKKIQKSGCNVLLIQKSILRDAVNDLSLHFLAKMKIMVVKDVERTDIEFISRTLGCKPIAHVDSFTADKLGSAELVEEVDVEGSGERVVKVTGVPNPGHTMTVLVRGSNRMVLDEADRSLHDALCVVRSLVQRKFMIPGGGAPETEVAVKLMQWAKGLRGAEAHVARAYAEALEVIPYTLAENAGLHPLHIVTELRRQHAAGRSSAGINVRKGGISDMVEENVLQPLVTSLSALKFATETVVMILKIDDLVPVR